MKLFDYIFNRCSKEIYTPRLDSLIKQVEELSKSLRATREDLVFEREMLENRIKRQDAILEAVVESASDMIWFKALDGKYEVANKAIRDGLLFDRNPLGKNDIELAKKAKIRFGNTNHTFGETCADSDKVVIDKAINDNFRFEDGRFFEYGKVKGKMLYLEVNKAPVYIDGELIGVVGTGRDMTEYVKLTQNHNCRECPLMDSIFDRYKYINKDEDGKSTI